MNKLKMTVLAALVCGGICIKPSVVVADSYNYSLQIEKAIKVLENFNKRSDANFRMSEDELAEFEANAKRQYEPVRLWNAIITIGLSFVDKYREQYKDVTAGGKTDNVKLAKVLRGMFKEMISIAYPVVLSAKARAIIDREVQPVVDYEPVYVLMNAIEAAQEELGIGVVGAVAGFSSAIGGLHALGTGISHWVAKDKQDRGLLLPEKVTLDYKVGDYVASKGAVKYVGNIVKDGIMIGTVTIRTSIPGPSTGFMRVSAKVKLSSRTYSYSKMQVQSKVEGPLQVTLTSKKAEVPILPLLFGGDKVAGKIAGYEFECSR